jgi:glycine/D-amino acid oxidase-like deaminating enzyme
VIEHPYWWDTVGSPEPARRDPLDVARVDAAIVGGGYTGLSAARTLARKGASVLVLERDVIGAGASSRNGGQVLTGLKVEPATLVRRYGITRARALFDAALESIATLESVIATESIDCEYERTGHLQAAWKRSHFEAFREEQQLLADLFGHRVDLVSPASQAAELGSTRYHGLLIDERSAGLNPAKYTDGLASAAKRAGARLATGAIVQQVDQQGKNWRLRTTRGPVSASNVLVATNGYTSAATPALRRRVVPVGSYVIATEPLDGSIARRLLPRRRMAFDSKNFLYYFRLTADSRLLFGGRAEFSQPTTGATRHAADILRRGMIDVFPDLREVRVDYAWSGNVAFTRDQLPRAGCLDGMFYAGGYGGHGIAMATELGDLIARRMSGESVSHPLFDDRPPAIPLYGGRPWFLSIVGAYYHVMDFIH